MFVFENIFTPHSCYAGFLFFIKKMSYYFVWQKNQKPQKNKNHGAFGSICLRLSCQFILYGAMR
jgi:hypothetical protein